MPSVGPSVDRRTFGHLAEVYNSDNVRSLICVCCAQIHTDTGSGRFNAIGMTSGEDQLFNKLRSLPHGRGEAARRLNFDQEVFTERYATRGPLLNAPELAPASWEWRQELRLGDDPAVSIICCPEDVSAGTGARKAPRSHSDHDACPKASSSAYSPLPQTSARVCITGTPSASTAAFRCAGDAGRSWWRTTRPTWASPWRWATTTSGGTACRRFTIGKFAGSRLRQRRRSGRASLCFTWKRTRDILWRSRCSSPRIEQPPGGTCSASSCRGRTSSRAFCRTCGDVDLARLPANQGLPHGQEMLSRMVRFHVRIASVDASKHIEHARLRPHVVLKLLHALIDRQHEVFMRTQNGQRVLKAPAALLKQRMAEAVAAKFPEDPADARLPEAQRRGTIPPMVWDAMLRARQEPRRGSAQKNLIFDKNATPAAAPEAVEDVFASARPHAIVEERSSRNVEDINVQHAAALAGYSTLRVQTDSRLQPQWESWYLSSVFPWEIPRMVGGADYWPKKRRWRRTEADAPVVSPFALTKGLPRRAEGQIRSSWTLVPALYNLFFRWSLLNTGKLSFEQGVRMSRPTEDNAMELIAAAKGVYQKLWSGSFKSGNRRRAVAGDTTRLARAEGITPTERALVRSLGYMSSHIPGTQQIRVLMGHALFGTQGGLRSPSS